MNLMKKLMGEMVMCGFFKNVDFLFVKIGYVKLILKRKAKIITVL